MFIVQFPAAYCLAMVASLADSTEPTRLEAVLDLDGQGRVSVTSGTGPTAEMIRRLTGRVAPKRTR